MIVPITADTLKMDLVLEQSKPLALICSYRSGENVLFCLYGERESKLIFFFGIDNNIPLFHAITIIIFLFFVTISSKKT